MAHVQLTLEEYHALMRLVESERESEGAHEQAVEARKKPMQKSKYRIELTKQQRIVEKKHPRMDFKRKSEKAHQLTRQAMGMRKKRN
jgi:hypothetical protein